MKKERPFLLVNINNTNTSFALANSKRILRVVKVPTASVHKVPFAETEIEGIVLGSVVPKMTKRVQSLLPMRPVVVSADVDLGVGVRYPHKKQIGADPVGECGGRGAALRHTSHRRGFWDGRHF